ncbi:GtrA family protein [Ectothiorhodospira variabilis]|uniref:GtrA family protein n=1 Tax=Ectothiorhodospira variabilis TaxID=505694 RepID=UPI001EFA8A17|nr:GtrA family protein [Ectothiorhodospira variabilis]MCG5498948.1 GtrA family protein [Ectothiorhodospira variabilis]
MFARLKDRVVREMRSLTFFALVGASATATHLGVAWLVLSLSDHSVFVANALAFVVAFVVSYLGHSRLTFVARKSSLHRFALVALGGFALNNLLLGGVVFSGLLDGFLAIVVATLAVPLLVYFAARFWAFDSR